MISRLELSEHAAAHIRLYAIKMYFLALSAVHVHEKRTHRHLKID